MAPSISARDNVVVYPTAFGGDYAEYEPRIKPGMALDPDKYFIIVPSLFGGGFSSSPSNTPEPYGGPRFPQVTIYDNVVAQHRLVAEKFGVSRVKLVTGFSMGAIQTYHWGALYPDEVERIAPYCGAARCSRHNYVFLGGLKAALTADAQWNEGWYKEKPAKGLRAFGRVYAGWAFSQAFYRAELDLKTLGFSSLEDFMVAFWEGLFLPKDANNLLAMLWTWQHGDIPPTISIAAILRRRCGRSGPRRMSCRARPISISRLLTTSSRWPRCLTPNASQFPLSGAMSLGRPPIRPTLTSSTAKSPTC